MAGAVMIAGAAVTACAPAAAAPATTTGTSFACPAPRHHDGDAIRCRGGSKSMRLFGIDAPEMTLPALSVSLDAVTILPG